jgi:hypothetical protein
MPSKKRYYGYKPAGPEWSQIAVVDDEQRWLVFVRPDALGDWDSVKVVADGRAREKANYWLGWNGLRWARHGDLVALMRRPSLLAEVEQRLRERADGLDLL